MKTIKKLSLLISIVSVMGNISFLEAMQGGQQQEELTFLLKVPEWKGSDRELERFDTIITEGENRYKLIPIRFSVPRNAPLRGAAIKLWVKTNLTRYKPSQSTSDLLLYKRDLDFSDQPVNDNAILDKSYMRPSMIRHPHYIVEWKEYSIENPGAEPSQSL